jgi:hypothetical protein
MGCTNATAVPLLGGCCGVVNELGAVFATATVGRFGFSLLQIPSCDIDAACVIFDSMRAWTRVYRYFTGESAYWEWTQDVVNNVVGPVTTRALTPNRATYDSIVSSLAVSGGGVTRRTEWIAGADFASFQAYLTIAPDPERLVAEGEILITNMEGSVIAEALALCLDLSLEGLAPGEERTVSVGSPVVWSGAPGDLMQQFATGFSAGNQYVTSSETVWPNISQPLQSDFGTVRSGARKARVVSTRWIRERQMKRTLCPAEEVVNSCVGNVVPGTAHLSLPGLVAGNVSNCRGLMAEFDTQLADPCALP